MSMTMDRSDPPRLAELVGALSLATDLAGGLGYETALRTALIAARLGDLLGLRGDAHRDLYYTGLLRFIGCTAFAYETARVGGGDDMGLLRQMTPADAGHPVDLLRTIITRAGCGAPPLQRAAIVARVLSDPGFVRRLATAHCDLAVALAARLGMSAAVTAALGQLYERYDGKGIPNGVRGDQIVLGARVLHVAFRAEAQRGLFGPNEAVAAVAARAGGELDPEIATALVRHAREVLPDEDTASAWDAFLAAEPGPPVRVEQEQTDNVALAFAQYVDAKSPFTLGHSTGVADLAAAVAEHTGIATAERALLRRAALLHDLGRISVPNGIWDKPGALNPAEWERVRQHPYHSERILTQTPLFADVARIAAAHHERCDGSGYHRGLDGARLGRPARLLAAADAYHALTEPRPHRDARPPAIAAKELAAMAAGGTLDREAVEQVLAAAGQRAARLRGTPPASLSEREAEVLCLLARGLSNKQIAAKLVLSPRTVQHHVEHIYTKTNVRTRAAAALFAVQNDMIGRWES
jgi:putative nucleotidyltransferase with HDIG domain